MSRTYNFYPISISTRHYLFEKSGKLLPPLELLIPVVTVTYDVPVKKSASVSFSPTIEIIPPIISDVPVARHGHITFIPSVHYTLLDDISSNLDLKSDKIVEIESTYSIKGLCSLNILSSYHLYNTIKFDFNSIYGVNISSELLVVYYLPIRFSKNINAIYSLFNQVSLNTISGYGLDALSKIKQEELAYYTLLKQEMIVLDPIFKLQVEEEL